MKNNNKGSSAAAGGWLEGRGKQPQQPGTISQSETRRVRKLKHFKEWT